MFNITSDILKEYITDDCKDYYVYYSSGLDSTVLTYLLFDYAMIYNRNMHIHLLELNCNFFPHIQQEVELQKRDKFHTFLKEKYSPYLEWDHNRINLNCSYDNYSYNLEITTDHFQLTQQTLMISLSGLVNSNNRKTVIFMGYVKGDDFCNERGNFENYIESLNKLLKTDIVINTPFIWMGKYCVYRYAEEHHLLRYISYCEFPSPQGDACGRCHSCIEHKYAMGFSNIMYNEKLREDFFKI